MLSTLRRKAGSASLNAALTGLALGMRARPKNRPERRGIDFTPDVAFGGAGAPPQRLDVYRPQLARRAEGPLPVVLYIHGGGFRMLSKDTHWYFGQRFARAGYLTFVIDYRLAPRHPFPAGVRDAQAAYKWVVENAAAWGGDASRIIVAGESAGANLATGVALASCARLREPSADAWADEVFALAQPPAAVIALCGFLQLSQLERHAWRRLPDGTRRARNVSTFASDRLREIVESYWSPDALEAPRALAEPLLFLEGALPGQASPPRFERSLPPFFISCGEKDPVLTDSVDLDAALRALGVDVELRTYEGELHAFQALPWRPHERASWEHLFAFLDARRSAP